MSTITPIQLLVLLDTLLGMAERNGFSIEEIFNLIKAKRENGERFTQKDLDEEDAIREDELQESQEKLDKLREG